MDKFENSIIFIHRFNYVPTFAFELGCLYYQSVISFQSMV